jgi:hypothetical protein
MLFESQFQEHWQTVLVKATHVFEVSEVGFLDPIMSSGDGWCAGRTIQMESKSRISIAITFNDALHMARLPVNADAAFAPSSTQCPCVQVVS